jgi:hypothetical protein
VHASGASNDTGGENWPSAIKQVAQQRGLAFIVLTDHSNSVGSDVDALAEDPALFNRGPEFAYTSQAESLTAADSLMLSGSKISPRSEGFAEPNGHIGCIPTVATVQWSGAFVHRPRGRVSGALVLTQAQAAGCFRIIHHPYAFARWLAFDWTAFDYEAIEVWNGGLGYDVSDHHALGAWACDLSNGRWPTLVGA